MRESVGEFIKFIAAGVANTGVGFGIFWLLNQTFGMNIAVSNAIGYAVALLVSYFLNRNFVFQRRARRDNMFVIFLICFGIAFAINQGVLLFLAHMTVWHPGLIQLAAMASYTVVFFALNRFAVFRGPAAVGCPINK